ncbi:transposase [Clostridium grantii]|uniref:transposase n=1 Tax=Clostridium grantii TaxID=40575 RepID=UPI000935503F
MEGNIKYYNNEYEILCYCLMDNHVHLLLHTYNRHMKFFMKRINSIYPRYFNDKYNLLRYLIISMLMIKGMSTRDLLKKQLNILESQKRLGEEKRFLEIVISSRQ